MEFLTEDEIFERLWATFTSLCADVTFKRKGGVAWSLLRTAAYGLRLCYLLAEGIYRAIWPTFGNRIGIRNWMELLAQEWVESRPTAEALADVLEKFRESSLGTVAWYEAAAVARFEEVAKAYAMVGRRGPNTIDVLVVNAASNDVANIEDIQDYFDEPSRRVGHIDVRVITASEYEAQTEAAYNRWGESQ
jgi:hypothetical protein